MGIRETLNQNQALATGSTIAVLVAVVGFAVYYSLAGGSDSIPASGPQAYFSDDDGKTFFLDEASKIPPFDHQGKPAAAASLYLKPDGSQGVAYLTRYTPEGKAKLASISSTGRRDTGGVDPSISSEMEVKAPGEKEWIKRSDPRASKIMQPIAR